MLTAASEPIRVQQLSGKTESEEEGLTLPAPPGNAGIVKSYGTVARQPSIDLTVRRASSSACSARTDPARSTLMKVLFA